MDIIAATTNGMVFEIGCMVEDQCNKELRNTKFFNGHMKKAIMESKVSTRTPLNRKHKVDRFDIIYLIFTFLLLFL